MTCQVCGSETVSAGVPDELRQYLPDDRPGVALCTHCLSVTPVDDPPEDLPDFTRVSAAFPGDPDRALPVVLVLALLDSLALYRAELDELAAITERRGVDPLLVLDRLGSDPALEPAMDIDRRRDQLAQLLA